MTATAVREHRKFTPDEYLMIEEKAAYKSEFYDGEVFAMAGASDAHVVIAANLTVEIGSRLKGGKCRPRGSDQRVKVEATGLYTYPDLLVLCEEPRYDKRSKTTLVNPNVLFEVLSPSTENYDRGTKLKQYMRIPSIKEVVLVSQSEFLVEVHSLGKNGWTFTYFEGEDAVVTLKSLRIKVPMADIYGGVTFEVATTDEP